MDAGRASRPEPSPARAAAGLAAAVVLALLFLAPRTTLWDRDEPRHAEAAREILGSGQWLVPELNGAPFLHKPPLVVWLIAAGMKWTGVGETAARLPSALAFGAAVLLTFDAGRTLVSARAGLLAAAFLATAPLAFLEGAAATMDALLLASVTAILALFARAVRAGPRPAHLLGIAAASACGQLAKGPVALALPALPLLLVLAIRPRDLPRPRALAAVLIFGSLAGLAALLLWAVPADGATGGRVVAELLGRHVAARVVTPIEGHAGGLLYYLPVLLVGFSPWTLYLPGAARRLRGDALDPAARAILVATALAPFVLFTAVATKLPHYVLPAWPSLAILAAAAVAVGDGAVTGIGLFLLLPLVAAELVALALLVWLAPVPGLGIPALAIGLLLAAAIAGGLAWSRRGRGDQGAAWMAGGVFAAEVVTAGWLLPRFEAWKPVPVIAAAVRRESAAEVPAATFRFEEPSLDFYLARPPIERLRDDASLVGWAARPGAGVLVTTRDALVTAERLHGRLPLREIAARKGFNVANGEPLELVALRRR